MNQQRAWDHLTVGSCFLGTAATKGVPAGNSDTEGGQPSRKRRWGASTAATQKKPSISITTESLKVRWEGPAKPRVPCLLAQWSVRKATHRTSRSTGTSASQETGLAAPSPAPSQAKRTMQKPPHARQTAAPTPSADTVQPPPLTTRASALPAAGGPGRGDFPQHDSQTPARLTSAASTLPCSEHLPCSALVKATVYPGLDSFDHIC